MPWIRAALLFFVLSVSGAFAQGGVHATYLRNWRLCNPLSPTTTGQALSFDNTNQCWGIGPTNDCGSAVGCTAMTEGATAPTPAAGKDILWADSATHQLFWSKNGSLFNPLPGSCVDLSAATSGFSTVETILIDCLVPANSINTGTKLPIFVNGLCTSSVANTVTFRVRFGTADDATDTALATLTATAGTGGTSNPYFLFGSTTFRSNTIAQVVMWLWNNTSVSNNGVIGAGGGPVAVSPAQVTGLVTSVANHLYVTGQTSAGTTTMSGIQASIDWEHN